MPSGCALTFLQYPGSSEEPAYWGVRLCGCMCMRVWVCVLGKNPGVACCHCVLAHVLRQVTRPWLCCTRGRASPRCPDRCAEPAPR